MQEWNNQQPDAGTAIPDDREWMARQTPIAVSPYADREILKVKDDYTRAVASGQYDEIQLEELRNKTDDHVNRLRKTSAQPKPVRKRDALREEFDNQVLNIDGKLVQQDPESGRFEVLSEPVKDERQMEEMKFQQKIDIEKGRIDLMKQLAGLATGTADGGKQPMYTPEQIRQEVDKLLPNQGGDQQAEQGGMTPEQFDKQWGQIPSGGTLVGPDGITYRKK